MEVFCFEILDFLCVIENLESIDLEIIFSVLML